MTPENFPEFLSTDEDWLDVSDYIKDSNANVNFVGSLSDLFEGKIETSEPAIICKVSLVRVVRLPQQEI